MRYLRTGDPKSLSHWDCNWVCSKAVIHLQSSGTIENVHESIPEAPEGEAGISCDPIRGGPDSLGTAVGITAAAAM